MSILLGIWCRRMLKVSTTVDRLYDHGRHAAVHRPSVGRARSLVSGQWCLLSIHVSLYRPLLVSQDSCREDCVTDHHQGLCDRLGLCHFLVDGLALRADHGILNNLVLAR